MSFLAPLGVSDPGLGGKARSLARLAALGFATPAGFVVKDDLFRALCPHTPTLAELDDRAIQDLKRLGKDIDQATWPGGFCEELKSRLRAIDGNRFAVRSSFASEDEAGALAPGVYESCVDVALDDVEKAIKRVLRSAISPGAAAYAMAHGRNPAEPPVAVLVHAFVAGEVEGSAALAPDSTPVLMVREGALPEEARAELEAGLIRLSQDLGSVEVEWVWSARRLVYLQARPFRPKAQAVEWPGWKDLPTSADDRGTWHWDAAHNPLPLSPAQAGLVELADEHCQIGIRQRVLGGYLFYAKDTGRPLPSDIATEDAGRYFADLQREVDPRLAALGPEPALDDALSLFLDVYQRIFGVLQPALKRARQALHASARAHAPEGLALLPALVASVPSMATERRLRAQAIGQAKSEAEQAEARRAYLARFGDEAPVWDVCAPTYAEDASPLFLPEQPAIEQAVTMDWQAASRAVQAMMTEAERKSWHEVLSTAREAIALSEADDWLYARVQAAVRRALLARGEVLKGAGRLPEAEDVFFLPLRLVRAGEGGSSAQELLAELAQAGRDAWQAARRDPPPTQGVEGQLAVHGHGTGGHALGRIALHRSGSFRPTSGDTVLLAQTLLPTELPLISAAAIVTEIGGPLDHVAAQARERGIPAVVGATGAGAILREGDWALVDGERGLVVSLRRNRPRPRR